MKNFFLALATLILIALLGTAIYIYMHPNAINKITNQDKKDNNQSAEKKNDINEQNINSDRQRESNEYDVTTSYNQSLMHQNKANLSGQTLEQFNAIWAQLMEHDKNGTLTEAESNIIADQQAMEYSKNNSKEGYNDATVNGPRPGYKPDPNRIKQEKAMNELREKQAEKEHDNTENQEQTQQAQQVPTKQAQQKQEAQQTQQIPVDNEPKKVEEKSIEDE